MRIPVLLAHTISTLRRYARVVSSSSKVDSSPTSSVSITTAGGVTVVNTTLLLALPGVREAIKTLSERATEAATEAAPETAEGTNKK